MKSNRLALLFLLILLAAGCGKQATTSTSTNTIAPATEFQKLKAKAEGGDAQAQYNLGLCCQFGRGVAQDYAEAVKWYRKAAEQGYASAQGNLGGCYSEGKGVTQDYAEAVKWYRKAAEQNNDCAQFNLGCCYSIGQGVLKDEVEAVKWYRKAAEQTNGEAQFFLGAAYEYGTGVTNDLQEAVKWYLKSANQGFAQAQNFLGNMYFNGRGVETNYNEAIKWFRLSAEQGIADAQRHLSAIYRFGIGAPKDNEEAFKWIYKVADQGFSDAQNLVGFSYLVGVGVSTNNIEAYKWFNLSAASGNKDAKSELELLEQQMTPEQVAEAQKLTREYKPGASAKTTDSIPKGEQQEPQLTECGTGFFITDDGYLISNYHVVKDAAKVRLLTGAGLIDATVVKVDAANDLALLKAVGRFAPLPIAASRTVKLGGTVATVGFPDIGLQGFAPKLAKGEIASLAGAADDPRYFQISLPVQPGNSGGALVDARGNVVGIVAAKLDASAALAATGSLPENVNYAVKSSLLLSFLESVPEVDAKLKDPNTKDEAFDEVVKAAQDAAVLVLVY